MAEIDDIFEEFIANFNIDINVGIELLKKVGFVYSTRRLQNLFGEDRGEQEYLSHPTGFELSISDICKSQGRVCIRTQGGYNFAHTDELIIDTAVDLLNTLDLLTEVTIYDFTPYKSLLTQSIREEKLKELDI